jgi:ABC-type antimicrobial peptide transport system permease subunit
VIRLAARRLWTRRLQALAPLIALLAATLGFQAVLVSARSTQSHVQGVIAANWNPPYDLLVRPESLVTGLKAGDHLAEPNYLESAQGGISMAQVQTVRGVPAVSVAAPAGVVVVDFLYAIDYTIDVAKLPQTDDLSLYRVTTSFTTDGGVSHIPGRDGPKYLLVKGSGPNFVRASENFATGERMTLDGYTFECTDAMDCYAPAALQSPSVGKPFPWTRMYSGTLYPYENMISVPIVAVDPVSENALSGIDSCMTSGRLLTNADPVVMSPTDSELHPSTIPVLMNATPGFDETVHATVEAAADPLAKIAPRLSTLPLSDTFYRSTDLSVATLNSLGLSFRPVTQFDMSLNTAWAGANGLGLSNEGPFNPSANPAQDTLTRVKYLGAVPNLSAAQTNQALTDPSATYYRYGQSGSFEFQDNPTDESVDTPFRALKRLTEASGGFVTKSPFHNFNILGKYNANCVSKKSSLYSSAFDLYSYPKTVMPNGQLMRPNAGISNFVATMPLLMTNLAGGAYFSDPHRFADGKGDAFLSVIRVKVSGTDTPGPASQTRLEQVAAEIHRRTGLSVDIIKGSSTETMSIQLDAGLFGRPTMAVQQDWLAENVAINFYNAINSTTVVMSVVVAAVAVLLTMQTTYATVRRRRGELVLLRAIGWPSWRLALLMEFEVIGLGVIVALVALLAAAFMILVNHPGGGIEAGILLAAPAAILLTALAGAGPALTASRTRPLAALRGPGRLRRRRRRLIRGPFSLGIREALTTWRWQTLLGALATAVGALFLGAVLAIIHDFHTSLDSTALAQQLSNEVGPFDVLLGVLAVALGATTAVSVVLVATRERLPHFATLRALGWSRVKVAQVVAGQAIAVGLLGGVLGVIALSILANRVKTGIALTITSQLSPLLLGLATGVAAAVGAVRLVYRRVIVTVLRVG